MRSKRDASTTAASARAGTTTRWTTNVASAFSSVASRLHVERMQRTAADCSAWLATQLPLVVMAIDRAFDAAARLFALHLPSVHLRGVLLLARAEAGRRAGGGGSRCRRV